MLFARYAARCLDLFRSERPDRHRHGGGLCPHKCLTEDWINVHCTAHKLGMRTTATMMFGVGETHEHRIEGLRLFFRYAEELRILPPVREIEFL